jgi:hypothetical protein
MPGQRESSPQTPQRESRDEIDVKEVSLINPPILQPIESLRIPTTRNSSRKRPRSPSRDGPPHPKRRAVDGFIPEDQLSEKEWYPELPQTESEVRQVRDTPDDLDESKLLPIPTTPTPKAQPEEIWNNDLDSMPPEFVPVPSNNGNEVQRDEKDRLSQPTKWILLQSTIDDNWIYVGKPYKTNEGRITSVHLYKLKAKKPKGRQSWYDPTWYNPETGGSRARPYCPSGWIAYEAPTNREGWNWLALSTQKNIPASWRTYVLNNG